MIFAYLLFFFISYSQECAPTSSVATTTVAPNTNTTQPANLTTTTVQTTTTQSACCSWPFLTPAINTLSVLEDDWNMCNQSISFYCTYTNGTTEATTPDLLAIVVNYNYTTPFINASRILPTTDEFLNVTVTCNTTARMWSISTEMDDSPDGPLYSLFGCAYGFVNGTWLSGIVEA